MLGLLPRAATWFGRVPWDATDFGGLGVFIVTGNVRSRLESGR